MAQLSDTQPMRVPALRLSAKIQAFQDSLTAEERWALDLAIRRVIAGAQETDAPRFQTAADEHGFDYKLRLDASPRQVQSNKAAGYSAGDVLATIGVIAGVILLREHPANRDPEQRPQP
jgi:hypothetical protein